MGIWQSAGRLVGMACVSLGLGGCAYFGIDTRPGVEYTTATDRTPVKEPMFERKVGGTNLVKRWPVHMGVDYGYAPWEAKQDATFVEPNADGGRPIAAARPSSDAANIPVPGGRATAKTPSVPAKQPAPTGMATAEDDAILGEPAAGESLVGESPVGQPPAASGIVQTSADQPAWRGSGPLGATTQLTATDAKPVAGNKHGPLKWLGRNEPAPAKPVARSRPTAKAASPASSTPLHSSTPAVFQPPSLLRERSAEPPSAPSAQRAPSVPRAQPVQRTQPVLRPQPAAIAVPATVTELPEDEPLTRVAPGSPFAPPPLQTPPTDEPAPSTSDLPDINDLLVEPETPETEGAATASDE